ncbi:MgtE integral membrane region [Pyrolobus fumarii 1A]|uniref:MgtE integral membrane region n=1 Tax=Pyrolobus fumarii (strain DSM 11204 / 1A) TaxID=694429 RepID=G0EGS1_PYRF1|nr:magnesium transporter [Pyrolobus fumarii]AEM39219.1 MgtE integral membrane region [Pyrolobus fumarii 1A]
MPSRAALESMISLSLVAIGETIAGLILSSLSGLIEHYPHILALYPIMAAARGNIYATLGSRITSRLHLGLVDPGSPGSIVKREAPRIYIQSILSALVSATIALLALLAAGRMGRISALEVFGTAVLLPAIIVPILTSFTVMAATLGFRRSIDPDNYLTPLITLVGDIVVLPALAASAVLAAIIGPFALLPLTVAFIAYRVLDREGKRALAENTAAVLTGSIVELLTSYTLVSKLELLTANPLILAAIPSFNAENGAAIGVLASKLATRLHLGLYEANPRTILRDALRVYTTLLPAYMLTSILVSTALYRLNAMPSLLALLASTGALIAMVFTILTHIASLASYRAGLDPDNIVIPLMTAGVDAASTAALLAFTGLVLA